MESVNAPVELSLLSISLQNWNTRHSTSSRAAAFAQLESSANHANLVKNTQNWPQTRNLPGQEGAESVF